MANLTSDGVARPVGKEGRRVDLPVAASTTLYRGAMIAQTMSGSSAGGACVPAAGTSAVVGIAEHGVANSGAFDAKRITLEVDRIHELNNGTAGEACSEAMPLYSIVYAKDDNTVSKTNTTGVYPVAGLYMGMSEEGKVRVYIGDPAGVIDVNNLVGVLPAFAAGDSALPLAQVLNGATYDVPTTAANSTISLPAATTVPDGTKLYFVADGTKNGHTLTFRDVTTAISGATTASKRVLAIVVAFGAKWHCNLYIGP